MTAASFEFHLESDNGIRPLQLRALRSRRVAASLEVQGPGTTVLFELTASECEALALALQACASEKTGRDLHSQVAR
jgi:hypothetical protein